MRKLLLQLCLFCHGFGIACARNFLLQSAHLSESTVPACFAGVLTDSDCALINIRHKPNATHLHPAHKFKRWMPTT